jgi:spoIIIJ-associated protein
VRERNPAPADPRKETIVAKTAQDGPDSSGARSTSSVEDQLVREGDVAGDYLERLLDVLDYDGDIDLDVEAGRAIVSIDGGDDLDKLVGDRGAVLESLQELTRSPCSSRSATAAGSCSTSPDGAGPGATS